MIPIGRGDRTGMLMVKACPRCKGDMFVERDRFGWHWQCLQCGHLRDLKVVATAKQHPAQEENEKGLIRTA